MFLAAAALLSALFTIVSCYATGSLLLDRMRLRARLRRGEQLPLALVLGASIVHLAMFLVLTIHAAYRPVLALVLAVPIVLALWKGVWRSTQTPPEPTAALVSRLVFAACFAVFFVFYLFNAWAPESSPDGSSYHLGYVARYLHEGGFAPVNNMYAALSGGIEMLYVPAFAFGRHSAAALVHFAFLLALVLAIAAYGRRIGKPVAGMAAAILVFASPVVGKDGTSAYIDLGAAAIAFAVFYLLEIWDTDRNQRWLACAGLLMGYAYAAKYTTALIAIYALGFVLRSRPLKMNWKPAALLCGCAAIMALPWVIRNWLWYQDPVAPMANALFPNSHFRLIVMQGWEAFLRTYNMTDLWTLPTQVTLHGDMTGGILGPAFLLLPLGLLSLRFAAGRHLLAAGAILLAAYPANVGTRFLIPCLPFFSLALTMAAGEAPVLLMALMIAHSAASWPRVADKYAPTAWKLEHFPWRAALRLEPENNYLMRVDPDYQLARMIQDHVPAGGSVLMVNGGVADAYTTRDVRVSYESGASTNLMDTVNMGWNQQLQASRALDFHFAPQALRTLRLVQTASETYPQQWSVHELRFYYQGKELPRQAEWRLTASPNPWDVQLAFDNSPETRWRSWQTAQPGMYIQVDFGHRENVDDVRVETSPDSAGAQVQVEGDGRILSDKPTQLALGEPHQVRRNAIYELHQRGVDYLLMLANDYGASDLRDDPEGWGLKILAESPQAVLYGSVWR